MAGYVTWLASGIPMLILSLLELSGDIEIVAEAALRDDFLGRRRQFRGQCLRAGRLKFGRQKDQFAGVGPQRDLPIAQLLEIADAV